MCYEMLATGSKTPISILNEYLIGRGYIPKFNLVVNGAGTHNPTFMYIVEFDGHQEMGEGRSKQEAKHKAARKMLEYLNVLKEDVKEDVKLMVPNEGSVGYNAVGDLADYCKKHSYPEPMLYDVGDAGPPHAKLFMAKCCVSQLVTYGEARTKKQAKQIAAHHMVVQLKEEADEEPLAVAVPNKINIEQLDVSPYSKPMPAFQPQSLLYKDYHNAYCGIAEKSEKISDILKGKCTVTRENAVELCKQIAEELVVSLSIQGHSEEQELIDIDPADEKYQGEMNATTVKSNGGSDSPPRSDSKSLVIMTLELTPPIVSLGYSVKEAAFNLIDYTIMLCG